MAIEDLAREKPAKLAVEGFESGHEDRKLFSPLVDLVRQRKGFRPWEAWVSSRDDVEE